jgi:hypothetical protein
MVKTHKHIASLFASLALVGAVAVPMTVKAGTETVSGKESKNVVEEAKKSYISGDLGIQFVSSYYSRGLLQTPQGALGFDAQPYLDLYFQLYSGSGFVNKVTLNLGLWSNIASNTHTGFISSNSNWTEFDWTPGVSVVFAKNFTFTASYTELDFPGQSGNPAVVGLAQFINRKGGNINPGNGAAIVNAGSSPARGAQLELAYDDTDLLGMWALHPHVLFLQELTGQNSGGGHIGMGGLNSNGNNQLGQYYEIGIAPAFTFLKGSQYPITLTLPTMVGLGSSGFYAGNSFGYFSAGGTFSVPLAFIPSGFGAWTVNFGGTYYYFGHNAAVQNGAFNFSQSGVDHDAGVAFGGIGLTF